MDELTGGPARDDTWFSDEQLSRVIRADTIAGFDSPIPTRMVSNGEFMPARQTDDQRMVEARIAAIATHAGEKLGMSRLHFLATSGGFAAAFLAMNEVYGRIFEVDRAELFEPAAAAELAPPKNLFVFDDQLHMFRYSYAVPSRARPLAQGPGTASEIAGITKNPYNVNGLPDELGSPWTAWTDTLKDPKYTYADFHLERFIKDVYLDSQVTVGLISNAPIALFLPPGERQPITPRTVPEALDGCFLTGYQAAKVRDFINRVAGSQRAYAHGQLWPGKSNLPYIQEQIDQFHPDAWKGYSIAYSAKTDNDPTKPMLRWRMDDEDVAYPMYDLIRRNRQELARSPGFLNICVHKGLSTFTPEDPRANLPELGNPDDVAKAARDWPDLRFVIYHAAWAPVFFGLKSLEDIRAGKMRNGVPDVKWTTQLAQDCAHLPNVYCDIGTTFAALVTTFPTACAHVMGQLLKYWGSRRILFGTDSLFFGAPQWQIEALWRFQIPDAIASRYGYPRFTEEDKRNILGLNAARLYGAAVQAPVSERGIYKPVPRNFDDLVPAELQETLHDRPGFKGYANVPDDHLSRLRAEYASAGGRPSNVRYGWISV